MCKAYSTHKMSEVFEAANTLALQQKQALTLKGGNIKGPLPLPPQLEPSIYFWSKMVFFKENVCVNILSFSPHFCAIKLLQQILQISRFSSKDKTMFQELSETCIKISILVTRIKIFLKCTN